MLVSDSDDIVLALLTHILRRAGYAVEAVPRAEVPRRILAGDRDVIIAEACSDATREALRTAPQHARRVVLTARHPVDDMDLAYATLRKPLEFGVLLDTVRDCLHQDG